MGKGFYTERRFTLVFAIRRTHKYKVYKYKMLILIRNVLTRRREYGTYLATARRHRRRLKMQKRDE